MMKRACNWIPVLIWMLLIYTLSDRGRMSITDTASTDFFIFKTGHMIEYAVLTILLVRALLSELKSVHLSLFVAGIVAVLFAISDELHQTFILGRDGKIFDVMVDSVGIFSVLLLCYLRSHRKNHTRQ